jgi:hypothetical protein
MKPTNLGEALKVLETGIRNDRFTKADKVGPGTFICFTEKVGDFKNYHQFTIEELPHHMQTAFANKKKGYEVGGFKIIAIFDDWT